MKTYNIIIGVIASRSKIYDDFVKYYWSRFIEYINKKNYSIKIYLLYGDDYENIFNISQEHIFITDINDSFIPGCLKKTISFFEYIKKNYKFNYIFRTNLSSFIIIDNFIKLINSFPKKKLYAGSLVNKNHEFPRLIKCFVSGSGFCISNDIIDYIIFYKNNLLYDKPDDVAIGKLLGNIPKINTDRLDIISPKSWDSKMSKFILNDKATDDKINQILSIIKNNNHYLVRLKTKNRQNDIIILDKLSNIYYTY